MIKDCKNMSVVQYLDSRVLHYFTAEWKV